MSNLTQNVLHKMSLDPFVWILKLMLRGFIKADLKPFELDFVYENIQKHRRVLWINFLASIFVYLALRHTPPAAIGVVIAAMLAPVMVLGAAWFAVSFGGTPKKLIDIAMETTLWMFTAFLVSLSAMFISVGFVTSPWLWPVLILIYLSGLTACIQYDTADGMKAGLDDALLKHSRAMLLYLKKTADIDPPEE